MPAVLRGANTGQSSFSMGSMQSAKHSQVSNEAHVGHANRQV
jgi:hypothetical protein